MKFHIVSKKTLLIVVLSLLSINSWAQSYHYRADVEGMVCAFCVYSVGKNIRKLPGVDGDSVDVNLKDNYAQFSSKQKIPQTIVTEVFKQSGFKLKNLSIKKDGIKKIILAKQAQLTIKVDVFEIEKFAKVLRAIADIAVKNSSKIVLKAPQEQEDSLLKVLLMGRKQVLQVHFIINNATDYINLQLFPVES